MVCAYMFDAEGTFLFFFYISFFKFKYHSDHSWSKNIQTINQKETDVKDCSSNIIASDATRAYDLADRKPQPHLNGHQTIGQSFLDCELFPATSLRTTDYFFSGSDWQWGFQQGLEKSAQSGTLPKCGQSKF